MVNAYRTFERPRQDSSFFVFPVPFATLSCDRSVHVGSPTAFLTIIYFMLVVWSARINTTSIGRMCLKCETKKFSHYTQRFSN
jgi:hypothetical protein